MTKTLEEFADKVDELNKLAASRVSNPVGREVAEYAAARMAKHYSPLGIYKIRDDSVGLATIVSPSVDESAMSASAVINTTAIDREGEVILPQGVRLDDYRYNPVVLWNHGMGANGEIPIAKCEHPDGSLAINVADDVMEGTSYFAQGNRVAEQIFDLIAQRIVRATSIHVIPIAKSMHAVDGQQVAVIEESSMLEWSWGPIGVNPEALAKVFSVGRLAGSQIEESIKKSLQPFAPVAKVLGKGAEFTEDGGMPHVDDHVKTEDLNEEAAKTEVLEDEAAKTEELEDEAKTLPEDEEAKMDGVEEEVKTDGELETEEKMDEVDEPSTTPLGAQVATELHNSLSTLVDMVEQASAPVENPDTKTLLQEEVANLHECLTRIEGAFSSIYPDQPGLASSGEKTEEINEEAVKTWLRGGTGRDHYLAGISAKITAVASAKNLKPAQRSILSKVRKTLDQVVAKAKEQVENDELVRMDRLEAGLVKLQKQLEAITPKV